MHNTYLDFKVGVFLCHSGFLTAAIKPVITLLRRFKDLLFQRYLPVPCFKTRAGPWLQEQNKRVKTERFFQALIVSKTMDDLSLRAAGYRLAAKPTGISNRFFLN
jgi:hypothetical protein